MPRKWRAKTIRIGNRTRCNLLSERPEHVWILTEIRLSEDSGDLLSTRYSLAPRIKLQYFHPIFPPASSFPESLLRLTAPHTQENFKGKIFLESRSSVIKEETRAKEREARFTRRSINRISNAKYSNAIASR